MNEGSDTTPAGSPGLFEELRRRKVVRVGLAYVMASWALLQVVDVVAPILKVPDATVEILFWLLIAGFPIAVFLSWAFELTPDGIRTTRRARREFGEAQHEESIQRRRNRLAYATGIAGPALLIGMTLGAAAVWTFVRPAPEEAADVSAETLPTIAVLPFENMSPDPENAFFAAGVHEEILMRLSRLASVRVISRTSVMQFAEDTPSVPEIARRLGATHIVEGSVRRADNDVRITAQLIKAEGDEHVWADAYERSLEDIFEIQRDVAAKIVGSVGTEFSPDDQQRLALDPALTNSAEAYDAYLKAHQLYSSRNWDRIREALGYLKRAVLLDPDFAAAHQLMVSIETDLIPSGDEYDVMLAREALRRAEELAPDSVDTIKARAQVLYRADENHSAALAEVERALGLEPGRADLVKLRGWLLRRMGRYDEMSDALRQAVVLDPIDPTLAWEFAKELVWLNEYEEAARVLENLVRNLPGADSWFSFAASLFRVYAEPDHASYSALLDARIDEVLQNSGLFISDHRGVVHGFWQDLIFYLLASDRFDDAQALFDRYNVVAQFDLWFAYHRARALMFLGRENEARLLAESELSAFPAGLPGHVALSQATLAMYSGNAELLETKLEELRALANDDSDKYRHRLNNFYLTEALTVVDPDEARQLFVAEDMRMVNLAFLCAVPYLWYPLFEDEAVQAWLAQYPGWVQFLRDSWPDSRPFPFDEQFARVGSEGR